MQVRPIEARDDDHRVSERELRCDVAAALQGVAVAVRATVGGAPSRSRT
jgi:hypothetical protein